MENVFAATMRPLTLRRLRLFTGIVLFAYVTTHFLNHALGLISLEALDTGREWFLAVWRNLIGTIMLYGSLIVHFALALQSIYARRRLNMPVYEWVQLLLGLSVPFILALHVFGTRMAHEFYGVEDNYVYTLLAQWHFSPMIGVQQVVLFLIAWIHGCMGLHQYLRLKPYYARLLPYLYAGALLVPTLGLLGVGVAADRITTLAQNRAWLDRTLVKLNAPGPDGVEFIYRGEAVVWAVVLAALALVLILRAIRRWRERRSGLIRVTYPGGRKIEIAHGPTLLEISRQHDIPHASVCGGRGRCSTCRVRVSRGLGQLDPPAPAETAVLHRVGAPPNVRLACQTRPKTDIEITPLLPPNVGPATVRQRANYLEGREQEITILFADLRAFTRFAEHKLPYDVVFVLNRYFAAMGTAIEQAGGHVDKFIGDGVMALFGIDRDKETAARQALIAVRAMAVNLKQLNQLLASDLDEPLRIGIGLHAGAVIVGEMGYKQASSVTAIGDAVNTASRLEALTKELDGQLVVSQRVVDYSGCDLTISTVHEVMIRGRRDPLQVHVIKDATELQLEPVASAAE